MLVHCYMRLQYWLTHACDVHNYVCSVVIVDIQKYVIENDNHIQWIWLSYLDSWLSC